MSNISTTATRTPYAVTNSTTGVSSSTPINTASSTTPVATASTTPNVSTTPPQGANVANTQNTGTVSASTTSAYGSSASNSSSKPVSSTTPCSSDSMSNSSSNINSSELSLPSIVLNNGQNGTSNLGAVSGTVKDLIDLEYGDINEYMNYQEELAQKQAEFNALKDEDVFEGMSYEEILQYRAENAVNEACKRMYERYVASAVIFEHDKENAAYYNYVFNFVTINKDEDATNDRGYGNTYFHEIGHMIDDYADYFGYLSNRNKYDFIDALRTDFETYVENIMIENSCDRTQAYGIIEIWLKVDADMKNGVGDIINGITNNGIESKWNHKDCSDKAIERECFAHFFEAGMSYKPLKTMYIKEVFPNAYKLFEEMLYEDLRQTKAFERKQLLYC